MALAPTRALSASFKAGSLSFKEGSGMEDEVAELGRGCSIGGSLLAACGGTAVGSEVGRVLRPWK
jgi:hypothetical protein